MLRRTRILIVLALLAIAAAGAAWWSSASRTPATAQVVATPRAAKPPSLAVPPPSAADARPRHLRRLLNTRLDNPKVLRIERVRVVQSPTYAGVTCGEVAWGDTPAAATKLKRFIATRRIVHIEGSGDIDALWSIHCDAGDQR